MNNISPSSCLLILSFINILTFPFIFIPDKAFKWGYSNLSCTIPGTGFIILWPNSFASLNPEPSEPVFGADLPPQDKTSLLQVKLVSSWLFVNTSNFFPLVIFFTLQSLYTGILDSSNAFLRYQQQKMLVMIVEIIFLFQVQL